MKAPLLPCCPCLTDREKIWTAMRTLKRSFWQSELASFAGCPAHKVQDYLRGLMAAGIVEKTGAGKPFTLATYRLVRDTGVDAPRVRKDGTLLPPSGRTRMWRVMRMLRSFTPHELAHIASLADAPVAESGAARYCRWLAKGGYLRAEERYAFVRARDSGPKAPRILRGKELFDPNTGEVVYQPKAEGSDAE